MTGSAYERRAFMGGAAATTITADLTTTDLSITLASGSGWDTSSSLPLYAVIDRGGAHEEKIRVTGISGTAVSLTNTGDRGCDGTTAQVHDAGESIEVCLVAIDLDEANQAVVQVLDRFDTKGDIVVATAAHTTATLPVGANETFLLADSTETTGLKWGVIPDGAIDSSAMLGASVVGATQIASNAVTTAKILDANVTTAKILDANVTTAKLAPGLIADQALFASPIGPTVASATEPTSPYAGMQWWDTDTNRLKIYDGTYWRFVGGRPPFCRIVLQTNPTSLTSGSAVAVAMNDGAGFVDIDGFHAPDATHIVVPTIDICEASFWMRVTVTAMMAGEVTTETQGVGFDVSASAAYTTGTPAASLVTGTPSNLGEVRGAITASSPRLSYSETVAVAAGYFVTPVFFANATTPSLTGAVATFEFAGYV